MLLHSRAGTRLEEAWGDVLLRTWQLFSNDLIPGVFRLILAFFRRLLDDVERLLYTVDARRARCSAGAGGLDDAGAPPTA